ncbi:MAG: SOS response-associated peptidase [Candidatus Omnitrophica bacterium]|nr:SOS response-associated peptidase [Candidatus Omnitrophota bacterium]
MCGRFSLISSEELIKKIFRLNRAPLQRRFNIAPSQDAPVIRITHDCGDREMVWMRWGLVPSWAKDPSIGSRMINAKSETLFDKPSFRKAARVRRCLIPADGFFEWKKEKNAKQPYYIHLRDESPFAMAGLWEVWKAEDGGLLETCTIITTDANELILPIHNRMPAILPAEACGVWLDPDRQDPETLQPLLRPYDAHEMALRPVSRAVNNPRNDDPSCIEAIEENPSNGDPLLF